MIDRLEHKIKSQYGSKASYCEIKKIKQPALTSKIKTLKNNHNRVNKFLREFGLQSIIIDCENAGEYDTKKRMMHIYKYMYDEMCNIGAYSISINLKDIKSLYSNGIVGSISFIKLSIINDFGINYLTGRYNTWDNFDHPMFSKEKNGSFFHITRQMLETFLKIN